MKKILKGFILLDSKQFNEIYLNGNKKPKIQLLECYILADGYDSTYRKNQTFLVLDDKYILSMFYYMDGYNMWTPIEFKYPNQNHYKICRHIPTISDCYSLENIINHYYSQREYELAFLKKEYGHINKGRVFNGEEEIDLEKFIEYNSPLKYYYRGTRNKFYFYSLDDYNKKLNKLNKITKFIKFITLGLINIVYETK